MATSWFISCFIGAVPSLSVMNSTLTSYISWNCGFLVAKLIGWASTVFGICISGEASIRCWEIDRCPTDFFFLFDIIILFPLEEWKKNVIWMCNMNKIWNVSVAVLCGGVSGGGHPVLVGRSGGGGWDRGYLPAAGAQAESSSDHPPVDGGTARHPAQDPALLAARVPRFHHQQSAGRRWVAFVETFGRTCGTSGTSVTSRPAECVHSSTFWWRVDSVWRLRGRPGGSWPFRPLDGRHGRVCLTATGGKAGTCHFPPISVSVFNWESISEMMDEHIRNPAIRTGSKELWRIILNVTSGELDWPIGSTTRPGSSTDRRSSYDA